MLNALQKADEWIMLFVQNSIRNDILTPVMRLLSQLGSLGIIWIIIGLGLVLSKKTRKTGFVMLGVLAISCCINELCVKQIVARPRPYITIDQLDVIGPLFSTTSFPSGHTCTSYACAYVLTKNFGKKGALSYVLAFLIAVSRVYIGAHYVSDIIAGMIVGTLVAFALFKLAEILETRRSRKK